MTKPAVIFDLDDTLIETSPLYERTKTMFLDLMIATFPHQNRDQAGDLFNEIDIANTRFGWNRHRYPGSMVETYLALCALNDVEYEAPLLAQCAEIGASVFEWWARPVGGVGSVLVLLKEAHDLYLLTMGDPEVQARRINDFAWVGEFEDYAIVPHKDAETLSQFLDFHRIERSTAWYVGDSLRVDIQPALANGLQAIHIAGNQWSYHEIKVEGEYHTVNHVTEVPSVIYSARAAVV